MTITDSDMAAHARIDYHGPTDRLKHFQRYEKAIVTLSALADVAAMHGGALSASSYTDHLLYIYLHNHELGRVSRICTINWLSLRY